MGSCASKPPPPNPNEVDLSHFDLLKVVGKGGFGKVNAITKIDTNELLALKRMEKHAVLQSSSHLKMVWMERNIMSMLTSPFLCNLLYSFEDERELFLVMPFMQGGDLRFHLKERGTMAPNVCEFYAAEIVLGLEHLHSKRVVFRDLKPDNMLLDSQGHLRISDFGLACILDKRNRYRCTGQAGTRGYQSPEVLLDMWYSVEADIWSFGVTIYELLHGVRPWKDWTVVQRAARKYESMTQEERDEFDRSGELATADIQSKTREALAAQAGKGGAGAGGIGAGEDGGAAGGAAGGADAGAGAGTRNLPKAKSIAGDEAVTRPGTTNGRRPGLPRAGSGVSSDDPGADELNVEFDDDLSCLYRVRNFHISSKLNSITHDFLRSLLDINIRRRLGCGRGGWKEVRRHPFFRHTDWEKVVARDPSIVPPIKPDLTRANCTADADLADQLLDRKPRSILPDDQQHFKGWGYRNVIRAPPGSEAAGADGAAATGDAAAAGDAGDGPDGRPMTAAGESVLSSSSAVPLADNAARALPRVDSAVSPNAAASQAVLLASPAAQSVVQSVHPNGAAASTTNVRSFANDANGSGGGHAGSTAVEDISGRAGPSGNASAHPKSQLAGGAAGAVSAHAGAHAGLATNSLVGTAPQVSAVAAGVAGTGSLRSADGSVRLQFAEDSTRSVPVTHGQHKPVQSLSSSPVMSTTSVHQRQGSRASNAGMTGGASNHLTAASLNAANVIHPPANNSSANSTARVAAPEPLLSVTSASHTPTSSQPHAAAHASVHSQSHLFMNGSASVNGVIMPTVPSSTAASLSASASIPTSVSSASPSHAASALTATGSQQQQQHHQQYVSSPPASHAHHQQQLSSQSAISPALGLIASIPGQPMPLSSHSSTSHGGSSISANGNASGIGCISSNGSAIGVGTGSGSSNGPVLHSVVGTSAMISAAAIVTSSPSSAHAGTCAC